MGIKRFPWLSRALAVLRKDLQLEFRTRYAYSALVMFALTTLSTISFSLGGSMADTDVAAALLWMILFFSAMTGLARTFIQEEEAGTVLALKMAADPEPVFLGKYLFNTVLLFSLTVLIVPLYLLMSNLSVANVRGFLATVLLGVLGLAGAGTILAAIAARAAAKGSVMTVLSFPILLPLLISAISATSTAFAGGLPESMMTDLGLLFFYNGIVLAASFLLFEYVWNE
ncbi:MAG: heme exporter protein CcmB [Dethiobacter sp.]|nr:heme exporter protein CcmB [Dethiobacter sp.]MCL5982870.1 heme exporter protein CcmB [Bacillota bacterium]